MAEEPYRILIAEDFEDNRIALKLMLEFAGFVALEAGDGGAAVEITRRDKPDLVLMDISLPEIDGLQATRQLRSDPEFTRLPIIIVSAHDSQETRDEAHASGGTDYISKPIDFEELKKLIDKNLNKE